MTTSRRRILRRLQPLPLVALTLGWVLLWGQLTPLIVVGGLVIVALILVAFPLPPLALGLRIRPWPLVVLVVRFLGDLTVASFEVAYKCAAPWKHPRGGLVSAPLRTADELFATITAQMTSLVPGTVVIDLDLDRHELLLHVFDIRDESTLADVRHSVAAQEARVLRALAARADEVVAPASGPPGGTP